MWNDVSLQIQLQCFACLFIGALIHNSSTYSLEFSFFFISVNSRLWFGMFKLCVYFVCRCRNLLNILDSSTSNFILLSYLGLCGIADLC